MSDFELQREAMRLADRHSGYALARMLVELRDERDALAAHVEQLHMAWVDAKRCVSVVAFPNLYRVEQYQGLAKASIKKLESAFAEQPATSLAKRDLIKGAEALEAEAMGWPADPYTECSHVRQGILESAAELRAKAKE